MALENLADARLVSRTGALEPSQHLGIEPQRHKLLGIVGLRAPALNELAAAIMIGALKKIVG
jgi:3-methyladenine DNA glycosylase/8-oxoguanine DNA glycosylase